MVVGSKVRQFNTYSLNLRLYGHKKSRWTKSETPVKLEL